MKFTILLFQLMVVGSKNIILILLLVIISGCSKNAKHVVEIPWALSGQWMTIDTHTHTRFSDGHLSVDELVNKAIENGCDALAITDHSDLSERAATNAYFDAINHARNKFQGIVLLAGIEWNIPPYQGREHVNFLINPILEQKLLSEFKRLFEQSDDGVNGFKWLEKKIVTGSDVVFFYNHPSRKDNSVDENYEDMLLWSGVSQLMVGFEAGPGHQNQSQPGTYKGAFKTIDRWDPVISEIGGTWDRLLGEGQNIWAALATSDFHNHNMDFYPCEFSRTHIYVSDISAEGILKALQAGSFWADHGHLLEKFDFFVYSKGLDVSAIPGETIVVASDGILDVYAEVEFGQATDISNIQAELISNCLSGVAKGTKIIPMDQKNNRVSWKLNQLIAGQDGESCYLRSRIRKVIPGGPDLLAYSNPIRVKL